MNGTRTTGTLFEALGDEAWARLREAMERREYAPGDVLIAQGTLEPEFHIIHDGVVMISASSLKGQRRELGALGPGDPVGDMSLLTGDPATADVIATTPVVTFSAPHDRIAAMGDVRSSLMAALAGMLAARLKHANERLLAQHAANLYCIRCDPADIGALARLPGAMAAVAGAPVLFIVAGDAFKEAPLADVMSAKQASIWQLGNEDLADLPRLLNRVSHEYDRIVYMTTRGAPAQGLPEFEGTYEVVRERGGAPQSEGNIIALTGRAWTVPALRDLTARMGRPVVAALPADPSPPGPKDPVAKLARVITGRQVGLALGAGAAKGVAHIGVLRAFEDLGLDIDVIAGCSIGAAIAAGHAAGYTVDELQDMAAQIAARAVRPTLPMHSFLSNKGLRDELEKIGRGRRFDDLDIPLAICATDIFRRCEVSFTTGVVWPRILASMAIPGIYPALRVADSYLVDGSVLNPVPARQCRELGAGVVVGVRLTGTRTSPREVMEFDPSRPLATETIMRCLEIMHNRLSELSRGDAEVTIEVALERGGLRDFNRAIEIAQAGHDAAIAAAPELAVVAPYIRELASA